VPATVKVKITSKPSDSTRVPIGAEVGCGDQTPNQCTTSA